MPKEAFLKAEIGGIKVGKTFSLSIKCKYYFQVQCQTFMANLCLCDLVVWTKKGIFTRQVQFNIKFMENVCQKLAKFWMSNVLPIMVQRVSQNLNLVDNVKSSSGKSQFSTNKVFLGMYLTCILLFLAASTVQMITYVPEQQPTEIEVIQVQENQLKGQSSFQYCGVDVYESDIQTLEPMTMVNDTIVNISLE